MAQSYRKEEVADASRGRWVQRGMVEGEPRDGKTKTDGSRGVGAVRVRGISVTQKNFNGDTQK